MERTFDRAVKFDERSKAYPIRTLVAERQPRSYTWKHLQLDQGSEGACFPAGTWVRMADGSHKRIENIGLLDVVTTAEGRTGVVMHTMVRHADRIATVRLRGHLDLRCTPEHPVLTERGYVAAADLVPGDKVAVTRSETAGDEVIEARAMIPFNLMRGVVEGVVRSGTVESRVARIPEVVYKTPAVGRLIGLYAAEGHTTINKVVWTFSANEVDTLVAETVDLIKTVFDAEARLQHRPNNSINVVLYGQTWRFLFERLVPGTSKWGTKHLSPHVASGPSSFRRAVLEGWLDGDGHARRNETSGITVSRRLALDMNAIANDLGLAPALRTDKPVINAAAKTRQWRYTVTIPSGRGASGPKVDQAATWRRVQAVDIEPWEGMVFNLHVEGDESYVADGVGVHNCTGFSATMEAAARPKPYFGDPMLGSTVDKIPRITQLARMLYMRARQLDEWPGEDYSGSSVLGAAKAGQERTWWAEYRWALGPGPERAAQDVILALGYAGPVMMGTNWYEGMLRPRGDDWLSVAGNVVGGHAFLLTAYSKARDAVWTPNSWGGEGQGWISRADLVRLLAEEGEACLALQRKMPRPS